MRLSSILSSSGPAESSVPAEGSWASSVPDCISPLMRLSSILSSSGPAESSDSAAGSWVSSVPDCISPLMRSSSILSSSGSGSELSSFSSLFSCSSSINWSSISSRLSSSSVWFSGLWSSSSPELLGSEESEWPTGLPSGITRKLFWHLAHLTSTPFSVKSGRSAS